MKYLSFYHKNRLVPISVLAVVIVAMIMAVFLLTYNTADHPNVFGILNILFLISFFAALYCYIKNIFNKRLTGRYKDVILLISSIVIAFLGMSLIGIATMCSRPSDNFGKDIVIPPDMKYERPEKALTRERSDGGFELYHIPPDPTSTGEKRLWLVEGGQGGIYHVYAYLNTKEAGNAYLKVFEATRNTPLSAESIENGSISQIKWSDNADEQFLYAAEITVYEGDWETYYPARFEIWFVPASKAPERKLIENIFLIEGWMR